MDWFGNFDPNSVWYFSEEGNRQDYPGAARDPESGNSANRKMPKKGKGRNSKQFHGENPRQFPKGIEDMWQNISFCFTSNTAMPSAVQPQQSLRLDIGKVQFALTSDRKDNSIDILKGKSVELQIHDKEKINVKFKKNLEQRNKCLQYLEAMFEEHVIYDYDSIEIDLPERERLLQQLTKDIPFEMKHKHVAVYRCRTTNTLHVVGEKLKMHKMLAELGQQHMVKPDLPTPRLHERRIKAFDKHVSLNESLLLGYFGFDGHIQQTFPGSKAMVRQEPPSCIIMAKPDQTINGDDEIRHFLSKIKSEKLEFNDELCHELLFDKYPFPNDSFYQLIKEKLSRGRGKDFPFYICKSETGEYNVNCLNEQNAKKVASEVESNIISMRAHVNTGMCGWRFLDEWFRNRKLCYKTISTNLVQVCCTSDIHKELQDKVVGQDDSHRENISLSGHQLTFLKLFGTDLLLEIKRLFSVEINFGESELRLKGKYENTQKSRDYLKSELESLRILIPTRIPKECIENKKDEIDRAMKEKTCWWGLQTNRRTETMLMNCVYLMSWIDPIREFKVTVVNGCPWHIDLDFQIVMVDKFLYPLQTEYLTNVPEDFISIRKKILEGKKRNMINVGEYIRFPSNVKGSEANNIVALVIDSDYSNASSSSLDIKETVLEILTKGTDRKHKNVGINVSMEHDAENIIQHTIEGAEKYADAQPELFEVFICCEMEQTQVLQKVNQIFTKKSGYFKKIHSDIAKKFKSEGSDMNIKIEERYLHELKNEQKYGCSKFDIQRQRQKADVIVNTTNKLLKLNEGRVSSKISELAGHSLTKECKEKYPKGLLKGQVAETKAHDLKTIKFIYHISVPYYNVATFREDIKLYVKKCLCQAERNGCDSIAFPALGVGRLQYPRRETAAAMFDAAEEYSSEVVNPVLKSVKFAIPVEDTMTHEAFFDEEWRRSKRCVTEIGLSKPFIKSDFKALVFKTGQNCPSVKISTVTDFGFPPAYAIEVFFGCEETPEKIRRKRAFDKPPSWNDRWFLQSVENTSKVNESLSKLLRKLRTRDDRVTEMVIYTNRGIVWTDDLDNVQIIINLEKSLFNYHEKTSMERSNNNEVWKVIDSVKNIPEEQQVEQTCVFFSKPRDTFLQEVIIVVSDEKCFQRSAGLLKIDDQMSNGWNKMDNRSNRSSIEVIGKTKECVEDGGKFIEDLLQGINEEIIMKTVSRLSMVAGTQTSQQQDIQQAYTNKDRLDVKDEVTAEINLGIVRFKKETNWNEWVEEVEKTFRLKVNALSDNRTTVSGDFSCILNFEHYLDTNFPANPAVADKTLTDAGILLPSVDKVNEQPQEKLKIKKNDKSSFRIDEMTVRIRSGNIMETEAAECIAVPCQGNLSRIFKTNCDNVGQLASACTKSNEEHGCLKEFDCRIVVLPPNASFARRIAVVHLPQLHTRTRTDSLRFMETFVTLLKRVDDAGAHTLTLPLLGSDVKKGGISLEECAEQYVLALCKFQDDRKEKRKLTEIAFVDRNEESVEKIQSLFAKNVVKWTDTRQLPIQLDKNLSEFNAGLANELAMNFPADQSLTGTKRLGGCHSSVTMNLADIPAILPINLSTEGFRIPSTNVKVFVAKGSSWDVLVASLLCFVDEKFKYLENEMGSIFKLAPASYKKEYSKLQQKNHNIEDVIEIDGRGGSLCCFSVLHAVFPDKMVKTNSEILIENTMKKVVKMCDSLNQKSLAVSLLEMKDQSSKSKICRQFFHGICKACQTTKTTLTTVHLLTRDDNCLKYITDEVRCYVQKMQRD